MPAGIKIDWNKQPLGRMLDSELAKVMGVSSRSVRSARSYRKILCYREIRICACGEEFVSALYGNGTKKRFCSRRCYRIASNTRSRGGITDKGLIDLRVALAALNRKTKERRTDGVEKHK